MRAATGRTAVRRIHPTTVPSDALGIGSTSGLRASLGQHVDRTPPTSPCRIFDRSLPCTYASSGRAFYYTPMGIKIRVLTPRIRRITFPCRRCIYGNRLRDPHRISSSSHLRRPPLSKRTAEGSATDQRSGVPVSRDRLDDTASMGASHAHD